MPAAISSTGLAAKPAAADSASVAVLLGGARLRVLRATVLIGLLIAFSNLLGSVFGFTPSGDVEGPAVALSALWCVFWALAAAFPRITSRCFVHWQPTALVLAVANALTVASTGGVGSPVLAVCMYVGWIGSVVLNARPALSMSLAISGSVLAGYLLAGDTVADVLAAPNRYGAITNAVLPVLAGLIGVLLAGVTNRIFNPLIQPVKESRDRAEASTSGLTALLAGRPILTLPPGPSPHESTRHDRQSLTNAEREVVALLAGGYRAKQIAAMRGVKLSTVRSQVKAAKQKTGARTLDQLVVLGWDLDR